MKKIRLLAAIAALLLCPVFSWAQQATVLPYFRAFDLTTTGTTYTFGAFAPQVAGYSSVSTSGSSTTITADATANFPFDPLTVGSILNFQTAPNTYAQRIVVTKTSGVSIVVNSAITLTTRPWSYQVFTSGTTSGIGWQPALRSDAAAIEYDFTTVSGTGGVNIIVQCRLSGDATTAAAVYTANVAAAATVIVPIAEKCDSVRFGMAFATAATGTDVLSAYLSLWQSAQ